jgi:hypothetical protein
MRTGKGLPGSCGKFEGANEDCLVREIRPDLTQRET